MANHSRMTRRKSANLVIESLEDKVVMTATMPVRPAVLPSGYFSLGNRQSPVVPKGAPVETATFIDPTTSIDHVRSVGIKGESYIAPFTNLVSGRNRILIGEGTNLQDNVTIDARRGNVVIGDNVALAHGVTVIGPATIGGDAAHPTFVSFNSVIDKATIQQGSFVSAMAKVGPGVVLRTGMKVLPGVFVQTQAEADDISLGKVVQMSQGDVDFVNGVLHVNHALASGYAGIYYTSPRLVHGIGANPSVEFNEGQTIPTTHGTSKPFAAFRNRIIGKATLANSIVALEKVLGYGNSIRADEGYSFIIGKIRKFHNRITFHALEHTGITVGNGLKLGFHTLVHGGPDIPNADPNDVTVIGNNVSVGSVSVVFRSTVGDNVKIGNKVLLDHCNIAPGTVIPDGTIMINNVVIGKIQW
jgi:carbonic anhydrase/acetyltransferase-like protein (isoleucine patch superfamily)